MSRRVLTLPISELVPSKEMLLLENYSTLLVSWFPRFYEMRVYQCRVAAPAHMPLPVYHATVIQSTSPAFVPFLLLFFRTLLLASTRHVPRGNRA